MNYSELLQLTKGWGNFKFYRIIIWRLQNDCYYADETVEQVYFPGGISILFIHRSISETSVSDNRQNQQFSDRLGLFRQKIC